MEVTRGDQASLPSYKDNFYGISQMDPSCDGADIARQQRYITDVTTTGAIQNLDYHTDHPVADGTQYDYQTDKVIKVKQGQEVTLFIKAYDTSNLSKTDGLRYCLAGGWIDLNADHTFNPNDIATDPDNGESLFFLGTIRKATPEFETKGHNLHLQCAKRRLVRRIVLAHRPPKQGILNELRSGDKRRQRAASCPCRRSRPGHGR